MELHIIIFHPVDQHTTDAENVTMSNVFEITDRPSTPLYASHIEHLSLPQNIILHLGTVKIHISNIFFGSLLARNSAVQLFQDRNYWQVLVNMIMDSI
jgi:hypothetical protein